MCVYLLSLQECEHKIQESDIQLRTAGEQLADATLGELFDVDINHLFLNVNNTIALKKAEGDMNSMQQKLDCETAALAQRSLENGPTGAALELVTKIGEFSKRRECLAKAVAAFKDAMKTSEAAMVHLDALSATLRSKIKTSMLTTGRNVY